MLTIGIGIIAFVVIYAAASNGEWGSVAVAVVILLFLMIASSTEREDEKARANQRRYWAHYYDKDQVEARKRGTDRRAPVPYRDELDEYELYETIFDDD